MSKEFLQIWKGERRLLPTSGEHCDYALHCLDGVGYLRIMSQAYRKIVRKGTRLTMAGSEVATLSALENMTVKIEAVEEQDIEK